MNKITEEQAYNMLGLAGYSITQERKKLIVDLWKGQGFIIKDYLEEQDFYEHMNKIYEIRLEINKKDEWNNYYRTIY